MRTAVTLLFTIVFTAHLSFAAAVDFPPVPANATSDQILDALKVRGDTLKDFLADVKLTDANQATADEHTDVGKLAFQNVGNGNGRIRITFTQHIEGTRIYPQQHEYTVADGWVTDRDYQKKHQDRRQIGRPGDKMNILKIGGPFPIPIGQDRQDVLREFDVTLIPSVKDDPAQSLHLLLKPKDQTDLARKFAQLDVWVDRNTGMPVRIVTLDSQHEHQQTVELTNIRLNNNLTASDFTLSNVDPNGWSMFEEPYRQ